MEGVAGGVTARRVEEAHEGGHCSCLLMYITRRKQNAVVCGLTLSENVVARLLSK